MKRVTIFLIILFVGCFAVDRVGGIVMQYIHHHSNSMTAYKYRYLFNECHEDMVLFGTSRCQAHYVPQIIEDSINMSVYNGGVDGSNSIYSHFAVFNLLLKTHKPKCVLLEIMPADIRNTNDNFDAIAFLGPYYGENEQVDSLFRLAGLDWKYKLSHLYRYNSKSISDIGGLTMHYNTESRKGYIGREHPIIYPDYLSPNDEEAVPVDTAKILCLNQFHEICKKEKVELICAISPIHTIDSLPECRIIKNWAKSRGIILFDYHCYHPISHKKQYFCDQMHMNSTGSELYSKIIASDLRRRVK